jgi:hypothetical protein
MIGRRAIVGLSLLSALLFCAFAAQSAFAVKSVNTTAYTCVSTGGETKLDFKDEHCDEKVPQTTGKFEHLQIPLNTTTEIAATNQKVTNETKDSEPATLKGKVIGGGKVHIVCTEVKNDATKSFLHNVETEKNHTLTGEIRVEYSKCEVKELLKCVVKEPIIAEANVVGTEGLGAGKNEMGLNFVGKGEKETFTEIEFKNKEKEACGINGKTFPVKGSAIGTCGPTTESPQTNKQCGATLVFTPKNEMEKLTLGTESAEFTSIVTPTMAGAGGKPISLTTTT